MFWRYLLYFENYVFTDYDKGDMEPPIWRTNLAKKKNIKRKYNQLLFFCIIYLFFLWLAPLFVKCNTNKMTWVWQRHAIHVLNQQFPHQFKTWQTTWSIWFTSLLKMHRKQREIQHLSPAPLKGWQSLTEVSL